MRHLLRQSLGRSLESLPELDRLQAAWPVACGKAIAGRVQIVAYSAGIVHLRVQSDTWLDQVRAMSPVLQVELAKIAGVPVSGIHFEGSIHSTQARNRQAKP